MLKILVSGIDPIPDGMDLDIERVFRTVRLTGDDVERKIIKSVDHGEYFDDTRFIDRLGVALYYTQLSTGCKAALCVHHFPTTPLCCIEMGDNALEAVIRNCKEGIIYVSQRQFMLCTLEDADIDICYKDMRFALLSEFADYLRNDD